MMASFEQFGQFRRHVGEGGAQRAECAAFGGADEGGVHVRQGEQGLFQGDQVARVGRAAAHAGDQAFQVGDAPQGVAQVAAQQGVGGALGDGGLPVVDLVQRQQGLVEPLSQQTPAHRRHGLVQDGDQAFGARAVGHGVRQFQVAPGGGVQHHEALGGVGRQGADVGGGASGGSP